MAQANPNFDCGDLQIKFYDADAIDETRLNSILFDDGSINSSSRKFFTINELTTSYESIPVNATFNVGYRVSLVDYETSFFKNSFQVTVKIADECDERLFKEGIILEVPQKCIPEPEPEVITVVEDYRRPVQIPPWFLRIHEELSIERGGEELYYPMGTPVNVYEEPMQVKVDFGLLSNATTYDKETNSINFDQSKMLSNETGYFHVVITASYEEPNNDFEVITFTKSIYLHFWEET